MTEQQILKTLLADEPLSRVQMNWLMFHFHDMEKKKKYLKQNMKIKSKNYEERKVRELPKVTLRERLQKQGQVDDALQQLPYKG